MTPIRLFAAAAVATTACADDAWTHAAPDCARATCDVQARAVCAVIDASGFEDVLAPTYDFDPLGANATDLDLARVVVVPDGGRLELRLGRRTIGASEVHEIDDLQFVAADPGAGESFQLRVFEDTLVGVLVRCPRPLSRCARDRPTCRAPSCAPAPGSPLAGVIGSAFDYSPAGERQTPEGHDVVSVGDSVAALGGLAFDRGAGATIDFTLEPPAGAGDLSSRIPRWTLQQAGSAARYEIRVFDATSTGVILNGDDVIAQLDCRGDYDPPLP